MVILQYLIDQNKGSPVSLYDKAYACLFALV